MTGSIPVRIDSLQPGTCSGILNEQRSIRNPFNSIHAVALINFAECLTGLAVLSSLQTYTQEMRGIVTEIKSVYKKKAKGCVRGRCVFGNTVDSRIECGEHDVEVVITDKSGDTVAIVTIKWIISRIKKNE